MASLLTTKLTGLAFAAAPVVVTLAATYATPWLLGHGVPQSEITDLRVALLETAGALIPVMAASGLWKLADANSVAQKIAAAIQWGALHAANPAAVTRAADAAKTGTLEKVEPNAINISKVEPNALTAR